MLEPVAVPFLVLAVLIAGFGFALILRPVWRRRRRRRELEAFQRGPVRHAIRLSPFQLLRPAGAVAILMADPAVQEAIRRKARKTGRDPAEVLGEARKYAREIVPALRAGFYSRVIRGPIRTLVFRLFRVKVRYADEAAVLGGLAGEATPVFILNHRSNFDYVIAAAALVERAMPSFAVGEWARYWPLEPFLRALGGFFVRRGSGNPLYRAVLATHVRIATRNRVPQSYFIEGRLSKDGRLGEPRLGLLSYALRAFDPETAMDIAFIPVAVNYDRVIEDKNVQIMKTEGRPPSRFRSWRATFSFLTQQLWLRLNRRWRPFGHANLSVGAPLSLRQWLRANGFDPRPADKEAHGVQVGRLAQELMDRIAVMMPVLPVPLMAAVIRSRDPAGITRPRAEAAAFAMLEALGARRRHLDIPRADWKAAVDLGVQLLVQRKMVTAKDGRLRILEARRHFVDYYANSIAHLFPDGVDLPLNAPGTPA